MNTILVAYLTILCLTQTTRRIKQFIAIDLITHKYSNVTPLLCMKRVNGRITEVVNI